MTTAIAYASGKPHIGNTYEIVFSDLIARAKRMEGYDVFFQTGSDEHGEKIELKAQAAGLTPKQYVDQRVADIKRIWDLMDTTYDKFIRTTDADHEEQVQKIFEKFYKQGDIYKGSYKGWYCTPCESFWTESQLVDGRCPDCGGKVEMAEEEAYFFNMSKYADRLINDLDDLDFIESQKNIPVVLVLNKCDSFDLNLDGIKKVWKDSVKISAKNNIGIELLVFKVKDILFDGEKTEREQSGLGSARQKKSVQEALERVTHALEISQDFSYGLDAVVQDLEDALECLGEVAGEVSPDDVLENIFSRFCVGK